MAERPQGPVRTQRPKLPSVAFPPLGRQFCNLAQHRRFASFGIAAPASQGEQDLVEFLDMDILSLSSGIHILPGRKIDEISDAPPIERLLLNPLTRMLETALLPPVPRPNDDLQGRNRDGGLIRCHEAGLDRLRLLDQVLQLLLDQLRNLPADQLAGGQAEEITKRVVGPGDAKRGIEEERADRRMVQEDMVPATGRGSGGGSLGGAKQGPSGGENQGECCNNNCWCHTQPGRLCLKLASIAGFLVNARPADLLAGLRAGT